MSRTGLTGLAIIGLAAAVMTGPTGAETQSGAAVAPGGCPEETPANLDAPVVILNDKENIGAAVRDILLAQQAAWNSGDIDTFMKGYWKSDKLRFASGGSITTGWQPTLERYRKRYDRREKMGTLCFSDLDISVLSGDSALVFGRWTLQRKDDRPTGLFTLLFRNIDDNWVIVHDHTSSE